MNLEFNNETYDAVLSILKEKKTLYKKLSTLTCLDKVSLKTCGHNDSLDNFQIFTPRFIVDDMLKSIGIDNITNNNYRILEPTSGDGAFTCRILELRLNKIDKSLGDLFEKALVCLSTIYSIEIDKDLISEQRNNIYTILLKYLKSNGRELTEAEDAVLRFLIVSNFTWAETNIYQDPTLLICDVAFKMPEAEKKKYTSINFPVWNFTQNKVNLHYEAPEIGDSYE